jgi:hypothetical protein
VNVSLDGVADAAVAGDVHDERRRDATMREDD